MPLATGWNTNLLAFIDAANFPGYVKTETLKCGAARVWFDSKGNLDAYVRSFSAAPNYNIRAAAD